MTNNKILVSILFAFFAFNFLAFSQNEEVIRYTSSNKGKFIVSWGGNRAAYTKSDIRFKGEDYDFTIYNASAKDKPQGWNVDYINPKKLTIPQTNFKIGFFITDHYTIAIGDDHMKYVMNNNRTRVVDGYINLPITENGSQFNGTYSNQETLISEDFLTFEHTNGLNYIYVEFGRFDDISSIFNVGNTDIFQLNLTEALEGGIIYPKTNSQLLLKDRYDEFHVSGYGLSFSVGLNFTFFKHFFIQGDLRSGYINLPDIRATSNPNESASQHFLFFQKVISVGGIFRV